KIVSKPVRFSSECRLRPKLRSSLACGKANKSSPATGPTSRLDNRCVPNSLKSQHRRHPKIAMSRFAIQTPYFIVVVALIGPVLGSTALVRMPVDMFPAINIPMVVVATFYNGMPPEQIETDITSRFERQFTLASGVEHIESRSLPGASVIRVYFQPGANADS